ncbi:MAG: hypothetical protein ACRD51_01680 [Candidatus Acidiferrum sp.]
MPNKHKKKKTIKRKKARAPKPKAKQKSAKKARRAAKPKKLIARKNASKAAAPKRKTAPKRNPASGKNDRVDSVVFEPKGLGASSGGQSGDLQGLSNRGGADSESVDELLEEGNAFEAEIVKGVQDTPDADEGEVRTHEVPEDDVPEEYLNEEQ